MKEYRSIPGRHDFRPINFPKIVFYPAGLDFTVVFDESCRYDLGADQSDWNKGGGMSFDLFSNFKDSAMWAWRYNPASDKIELSAYCHINGKVVKGVKVDGQVVDNPATSIDLGEEIHIRMFFFSGHYYYLFRTMNKTVQFDFEKSHRKRTGRIIGLWFGGNLPAPKEMLIFVGMTCA